VTKSTGASPREKEPGYCKLLINTERWSILIHSQIICPLPREVKVRPGITVWREGKGPRVTANDVSETADACLTTLYNFNVLLEERFLRNLNIINLLEKRKITAFRSLYFEVRRVSCTL